MPVPIRFRVMPGCLGFELRLLLGAGKILHLVIEQAGELDMLPDLQQDRHR